MILEILLSFLVLFFVLSYVLFNLGITNSPLGFKTVDRWEVSLDGLDVLDSLEQVTIRKNLESDLLAMDGVTAVSFTDNMRPFRNSNWTTGNDENGYEFHAKIVPVDHALDDVLDLNLIEGRWFEEEDRLEKVEPIILTKSFADKYYPGKSMVDSTFLFMGEKRIIGVVEAYRYVGEFEEDYPTLLILRDQGVNLCAALLEMAPGTPASYEEKVSRVVNTTTKRSGNVITNLEDARVEDSRESWVLFIALLSICGFLCINVALGLFGILWYNINKRRPEIGLRQALGAHGMDITKQFMLEALVLTVIALLIGAFFAVQVPLLNLTEYPDEMFYKAILYASIIILSLVFMCALFPSIQAARIRPATSLHED